MNAQLINDFQASVKKLVRSWHRRYRISPVLINRGSCNDFAYELWKKWGRHGCQIRHDSSMDGREYSHTFVQFGERYYDAEAPEGVEDWEMLPFFKRQKLENLLLSDL